DSSGYDGGGHQSIYIQNGVLKVRVQSTSQSYELEAPVDADTPTEMTLNFGSGGLELYVDGELVDSDPYDGGMGGNDEPIVIGARQWSSGNAVADKVDNVFDGEIDTVVLFDERLDEDQISSINNHGVPAAHVGTAADETITAGAGDDVVEGLDGADTLEGGAGADELDGGAGDDSLDGGAGDDTIDGDEGTGDVVAFSGDRIDYTITEDGGVYTVVDNRDGSPDGTDVVQNVETYRFADGDVAVANILEVPAPLVDTPAPLLHIDTFGSAGDNVENIAGVDFDGTVQSDGWTLIEDDPAFDLADGAIHIAFTANSVSGVQGLWSRDSSGYDGGGHQSIYIQNGVLKVRVQSTSQSFTLEAPVDADTPTEMTLNFGSGGLE
ncbi:MAG: LamG-like jellyroll fold domain-containing protein, partial [Pseudomonadota bacterium]